MTQIRLLAMLPALVFAQALYAGPSLTITPSTVSNTYAGTITLQVTGLTSGETVVIQKYLNLDASGVIGANDYLVQQFSLTDGQAGMVIGGVTNFNVPGDTDATAGKITTVLNFQSGDFIQNIVGKFVYKLSSPTSSFTPVTLPFTVTNFSFGQKFTGTVVSNGTGTVVSNGTGTVVANAVVLLSAAGGNGGPAFGTVANSSGVYAIQAPVGSYTPFAVHSGFVFNQNTGTAETLASGQTLTANLSITNSTSTISGSIVDSMTSAGLPGMLMTAKASDGLTGVGFTDPNGNFSLGVITGDGQWGLNANDGSFLVNGYLRPDDKTEVNAGATGVAIAVTKGNALFYGNVEDNLGNPVQGVEIGASDNNGSYQGDAYTDAGGNYAVVAFGGVSGDAWNLQINNSPGAYIFSQPAFDQNGGTNLSAGQAIAVNFSSTAAPNTISGYLKDGSGAPLAGINIYASTTTGTSYNQNATTDATGFYSINVANGSWQVGVNSCSDCGSGSLPGNYLDPQNQTVVIANNNATVDFTASIAPYTISGTLLDNTGNPIAGVSIYAYASINGVSYNQNATTGTNGGYSLSVTNGTWQVGVNSCTDCNGGLPGNYLVPQNQSVTITGASATANFTAANAPYTISGSLKDNNGNPLAGIGIFANATINAVNYNQYAITDANGNYAVSVLNGTWNVGVNSGGGENSLPGNYTAPQNQTVVILGANGTANFVAVGAAQTQTGSLEVNISPAGAVSAGAQWQVDGGASQTNGATVSGLSVGNHTVSFTAISGWTTPVNQTVSVSANATATASGTYVALAQTGSLEVTLSPAGAVTAGARWQVDGGSSQFTGATVANLSVGNHTVSFTAISGWTTPPNQTISITANVTATATGTYAQQFGSLKVTISPATAVTAGAKWQVDGGTLQSSGATVAKLAVGNHTVSFSTINGWAAPANQIIAVTANATAAATGTYVALPPSGSLEITLTPATVVTGGAQWQVDGGAFQNSGATVVNLVAGKHTVSFSPLSGWTPPANQTVSIKAKVVTKATAAYAYDAQGDYNGLFSVPAGVSEATAGMLSNLKIGSQGTYSATLLIAGGTYGFSGAFNFAGVSHTNVTRTAAQGGPLAVTMTNAGSPPQITGTISGNNDGGWVANLVANPAAKTGSADYTVLLVPGQPAAPSLPPGDGYLLLTNKAGVVTVTGALADGTSLTTVSQTVGVDAMGDVPIYDSLYTKAGLLLGWLNLTNLNGAPTTNALAWIKPASHATKLYTNGFTMQVFPEGAPWTNPPAKTPAIPLTNGSLVISNTGLFLTFNVAVSNNNTLVKLPGSAPNSLTGTITPKTGLLTVTFGDGKTTATGTAAIIQSGTNAGGFFLGATNAGVIQLQP